MIKLKPAPARIQSARRVAPVARGGTRGVAFDALDSSHATAEPGLGVMVALARKPRSAPSVTDDPDLGPIAAELVAKQYESERVLIGNVFADPYRLLPVADERGIETTTFIGDDHAMIWKAGLFCIIRGHVNGKCIADDHAAVRIYARHGLQLIHHWDDDAPAASTMSQWSDAMLDHQLFKGWPPSPGYTVGAALNVLDFHRRLLDAAEHVEFARDLLIGIRR